MPGPLYSIEDFVNATLAKQQQSGMPAEPVKIPVPTAASPAPTFGGPGVLTYPEVPRNVSRELSGRPGVGEEEGFYGASMPARASDLPPIGYYGPSGYGLAEKLAQQKAQIANTGQIVSSKFTPTPGFEGGVSEVKSTGPTVDTSKDADFQKWLSNLNERNKAVKLKEADIPLRPNDTQYDLYSLYKSGWKPGKDFDGILPTQFARVDGTGETTHRINPGDYRRMTSASKKK